MRMPNGYNSEMGERGANLGGGNVKELQLLEQYYLIDLIILDELQAH